MIADQASRTAEYAASFRAIETARRPARARLFEDRFAARFLSPSRRCIIRLASMPIAGALVRAYIDHRWPGAMTSGIARTRLIDDRLREAVATGIRQVVILGAGFDCRAYRLPELTNCRVIEVDHPATQAHKRERLAGIPHPPNRVQFVAGDLTRQSLHEVLRSEALHRKRRTFVLWEGVTHYLGETAVDATLRAVADLTPSGSRLVSTYLHVGVIDGTVEFEDAGVSKDRVAGDGEPWVWGMNPEKMRTYLAERGFRLIEDAGANEYRARYWGARGRRMRGFAFYRVAVAEVESTLR